MYEKVVHISKLCLTLKNETSDNKRTENERQNANASAKSKELHSHAQSQRNAAHLLLPQRTHLQRTRLDRKNGHLKINFDH